MKFIHLTDPHLIVPGAKLNGLDPQARFLHSIENINQSHADAECCVITGDLTDRAEDEAYQLLAQAVEQCAIPCHLLIGNHDERGKFLDYFPDTPRDANGFVQYAVETSTGVFLLLDTVQAGSHGGVYCQQRRQWLADMLEQYANDSVYLFMHHPPFNLHIPSLDNIGLADKQAFSETIRPYGNIRHLFFGHAHRPLSGGWQGLSFSSLRGTNHQVKLDFDNPKIAYIDEAPEYSVVFLSPDQIVVHTHAYPLPASE